jgi:hypothetical protein
VEERVEGWGEGGGMKYAQYAKYSCTITKSEKCDAGNISENG